MCVTGLWEQQTLWAFVSAEGVAAVRLAGLLGCGPLVTLRGLEVGPGPVEKSSVKVPEVCVSILPGSSLAQGQLLLQVAAHQPLVRAVQAANFSWLGVLLDGGQLEVQVWGEPLPRHVQNIKLKVVLGPAYSWLDIQVEGDAAVRHPASTKCTVINPNAKRHLRHGQAAVASKLHFLLPEQQQQHKKSLLPQPGGGHIAVRVFHRWARPLAAPPLPPNHPQQQQRDNLMISIYGKGLAAPLVERLLELPMDIHSGVLDGELHVAANDEASWDFPAITGKVACRGVDLHFWDAPDDILAADMDLLFERDRVYLHKATGAFGSIPLSVSGDMDLNPKGGSYRLQASVGPAEVNSLRASLGVRPIPFPVAGALRGVLHVTGPLEKPIFSGSASAIRPPPALLVGVEDSPALQALLADPSAVAAYDRVPATAANGVFTLDTSTEMFVLHSGQAVPAGGGLLQAAGKMWVAAAAESDPRAITMEAVGSGLNAGALAEGYVGPAQAGAPSPTAVLAGAGPLNLRGSLMGSHLAPTTRVEWAAPASRVTGSATFTPLALAVTTGGPGFSLRGSATTTNPTADLARAANTQAEATCWGTPRVESFQLEGSVAAVDLLQLAAAAPSAASPGGADSPDRGSLMTAAAAGTSGNVQPPPAFVDGSPLRLRGSGGIRLSAVREEHPAARRQAGLPSDQAGYLFTGPVVLEGLRMNQLSLARHLAGDILLTQQRLLLKGRGAGRAGDELLELDLALPPSPLAAAPSPLGPDGLRAPVRLYYPPGFAPAAGGVAGSHSRLLGVPAAAAPVNASGTAFAAALEHLPLDELELGSLRGSLVSAVLDVDLAAAAGRLSATLASPRFIGLAGTGLQANARWERDVVSLERVLLSQPNSKYELSGEYILPPGFELPRSITQAQHPSMAVAGATDQDHQQQQLRMMRPGHHDHHHHQQQHEEQVTAEGGRWRLQLVVPQAAVEELLPAGQLLRQAGRRSARNYSLAKSRFLTGLVGAAISAGQEFSSQAAPQVEYDISGTGWRAGPYSLDQLLLRGSADPVEGLTLDELRLVVGAAQLTARGSLLGPRQDASFALTDFPAVLLQPLFNALPALQHAAPALDVRAGGRPGSSGSSSGAGGSTASGSAGGGGYSSSSLFPSGMLGPGTSALSGLSSKLESSLAALGFKVGGNRENVDDPLEPFLSSPVSGLLNVRGAVGGSISTPTGVLHLRLVDGAIGRQRLARSTASLALNAAQQLALDDGGMAVLAGLVPELSWGGGSAAISLAVTGSATDPTVSGSAAFNKGSLSTSFLKHPITQLTGNLTLDDSRLAVAGLEAKVGPKGTVAVRGSLPLHPGQSAAVAAPAAHAGVTSSKGSSDGASPVPSRLTAAVSGIDLRVRGMYSGSFDAHISASGSLAAPQVGGQVVFKQGTAYLVPPAGATGSSAAGEAAAAPQPSSRELGQAELVRTAFAALKAGRARAAVDQRHQVKRVCKQRTGSRLWQATDATFCGYRGPMGR
eukprot:gene8364-8548_t